MEFHVITAGHADLVARLVDGQLVIVPPRSCVKRPDRHSVNESENEPCFTQKTLETRMVAELETGL